MVTFFYLLVLIFSVVIHEVSHGYAAKALGDNTAEEMGRLTLNPIKHIDPVGSILVPLFLYISAKLLGGPMFLFGWANPVPYNPYRLKNQKTGPALVAAAGPFSNLFLASAFGIAIRLGIAPIDPSLGALFFVIVSVNVMLAVFNCVPIPPMDGSKILFGVMPYQWRGVETFLTRNSMILFLVFLFFGFQIIMPAVSGLVRILTGIAL